VAVQRRERLFTDIILATSDEVIGELVQTATLALPDTDDPEKDLAEVGRRLITAICQPQVLRLRRLVIGEAARFPELGPQPRSNVTPPQEPTPSSPPTADPTFRDAETADRLIEKHRRDR
jgi:hypothetical protein